jgi:hypothetical protein
VPRVRTELLLIATLSYVPACGDDELVSSSAALVAALDEASAGDTVHIAAGSYTGSFVVPPGVALVGEGTNATELRSAPGGRPVVRLTPGDGTSALAGLRVRVDEGSGIVAVGDACVELRDLEVYVSRGLGVGLEDLRCAHLARVQVQGSVTADNVQSLPETISASTAASHGVVALRVRDVQLADVEIEGMAAQAAVFEDSVVRWDRGGVANSHGVGIIAAAGSLDAVGIEIVDMVDSDLLGFEYGLVSSRSASVQSTDLVVRDLPGTAVLHDGGSATHEGLSIAASQQAGLWVQNAQRVELRGGSAPESVIRDVGLAGIMAVDVEELRVADTRVTNVTRAVRAVALGPVEVGDGIQVVGQHPRVSLTRVALEGNARVGYLAEVDDADGLSAEAVTLTVSGDGLGAILQLAGVPQAWTAIPRSQAAEENDMAFVDRGVPLDVMDGISPIDRPATVPSADLQVFGISPID